MLSGVPLKSIACLWEMLTGRLETAETRASVGALFMLCMMPLLVRSPSKSFTRLMIHLVKSVMATEG